MLSASKSFTLEYLGTNLVLWLTLPVESYLKTSHQTMKWTAVYLNHISLHEKNYALFCQIKIKTLRKIRYGNCITKSIYHRRWEIQLHCKSLQHLTNKGIIFFSPYINLSFEALIESQYTLGTSIIFDSKIIIRFSPSKHSRKFSMSLVWYHNAYWILGI